MSSSNTNSKEFYDAQHEGGRYAVYASPEAHPFRRDLKALISRHADANGKWLEVGCGRGWLQDVVADYTGEDIAETVAAFLHKPFLCAPAEALPFPDGHFDGVWSYAVLEHVADPETALAEMRRVLKSAGILILAPAWQCRPWAGRDYAWKPYRELSAMDRIRKALVPLRNSAVFRAASILPARLFRWVAQVLNPSPTTFRARRLRPNYSEYRVADADALHGMDPFEAILWFRSRGDRILSHPGWGRALCVRTGALVVEVRKP